MNIYISGNLPKSINDKGKSIKLQIPVLPTEISCTSAVAFGSYNILDKGEVKIPNGRELEVISWESFFPGEDRAESPWIKGSWTNPKTLVNYFKTWIQYGVKLSVTVTGAPITNKKVYIDSFEFKPNGGFGDIEYSVSFVQAKDIVVEKKKSKRSSKGKANTYTVKKGDTLFKIARKFYGKGSYWKKIYDANKKTIEAAAKKHKKKSSEKGKYLYAGTKLVIPTIKSSTKKSKVTYYPKYKGRSHSIVDALKSLGINSSMSNRKKMAKLNNIKNYNGKAAQNTRMLNLLKRGKLIKSK